MSQHDELGEARWLEVIAKSLGFLSMQLNENRLKTLHDKEMFLRGFGFSRDDCAAILGSTPKSLAELERLARKKKEEKKK